MPRTNKSTFLSYKEDDMKAAVEDVRLHKTSIRTAAKKFGVPRTTLKYKLEGKSPMERRMGPSSILAKEEEAEISRWVENTAKAGFPITIEQLCISVERYLKAVKRDTPFKDGRPGRTWVKSFLRRNPLISKRVSQNLTVSRAAVTRESIINWFSEVELYINREHGDEKILEDPSRIFNCDESAFFLNPKGPKVLARKGDKTVYQKVNADEKECITVLVTGSASGVVAPTTCLFKYKRIPPEIADNYPKEWGLGKTDSGWMTCEAFFEFIADIFHPWLIEKQITLPVILFIDGHASHLSLQTSKFCEENGIILVALLPNATHILQPMDVAVFRSLKEGWKNKVQKWRLENVIKEGSHLLKKKDFAKLLQEVIDENVTESMLSNGFKKCGLYPWNPQIIEVPGQGSFNKQDKSDSTELKMQYLKQGLRFLNDMIGKEKLNVFQASSETWCGDPLDTSLFKCWKKSRMELERLELDVRSNRISANLPLNNDAVGVEFPVDGNNNSDEAPLTDIIFELSETDNINEVSLTDMDVIFDFSETEPLDVGNNLLTTDISLNNVASVPASNVNEVLPPNMDVVTGDQATEDQATEDQATEDQATEDQATEDQATEDQATEDQATEASSRPLDEPSTSQGVPSPFKRHFFYPSSENSKKKRVGRERIPTIVSGKLCQQYFENKRKKKEEFEKLKIERANERKRKREEIEKQKQKRLEVKKLKSKQKKNQPNTSSDSSDSSVEFSCGESEFSEPSDDIDSNNHGWKPLLKKTDEHVIFKYDSEYYPGKIIDVTEATATISSMVKCGRLWKWPERPDVLEYQWKCVKSHIDEPRKASKTRNVYSVPEMDLI